MFNPKFRPNRSKVIMLTCKQVDAGENQRHFAVRVIEKENNRCSESPS